MRKTPIIDLSVGEIMSNWPSTIRVFVDYRMHCIGCPISPFHTLLDAAEEHGLLSGDLELALEASIDRASLTTGQASLRRR